MATRGGHSYVSYKLIKPALRYQLRHLLPQV